MSLAMAMTDICQGSFISMPSHQLKSKEEKGEKKNSLLLRNSAAEVSRLLKGSIAAAKDFFGRLNWTILG